VEAHVVQFRPHRSEASFYVAQTLPVSELREGHGQILIPTREPSQPVVAIVTSDTATKISIRQESDQLREYGAAMVHEPLLATPTGSSPPTAVQIAANQKPSQVDVQKSLASRRRAVNRTVVIAHLYKVEKRARR
jgi:hypothetical protein